MQTASQLATTDRAVLVNLFSDLGNSSDSADCSDATDLAWYNSERTIHIAVPHTGEHWALQRLSELPNILTSHQISLSIGRSLVALFPGLKWKFRTLDQRL